MLKAYIGRNVKERKLFLISDKKIESPKMEWYLGAGCLLVSRLLLASWLGVVIAQP
jgi:hypothetical protein